MNSNREGFIPTHIFQTLGENDHTAVSTHHRTTSIAANYAPFAASLALAVAGFVLAIYMGTHLNIGGELAGLSLAIFGSVMALAFRQCSNEQ